MKPQTVLGATNEIIRACRTRRNSMSVWEYVEFLQSVESRVIDEIDAAIRLKECDNLGKEEP